MPKHHTQLPHVQSSPSVSSDSTYSSVSSHASISSQSDANHHHPPVALSRLQPLRGPSHDQQMGQSLSSEPSSPPPKSTVIGQAAVVTGSKLKRAFAGRRKKSEDVSSHPLFATSHSQSSSPAPSSPSSSLSSPSRSALAKLQLASHVFARKPQKPSSPPLPPPKPALFPIAANKPLPLLNPSQDNNPRNSIMPVSPGMTSALQFMRLSEEQDRAAPLRQPVQDTEKLDPVSPSQKEIWRKSDSTMSYHTIRPGAAVGSRTPRPVSMAESLHSNHTIVPVNKRISALLSDSEATPEEPDGPEEEEPSRSSRRPPSSSSLKNKNRRSASFTFGTRLATSTSRGQSSVTNDLKRTTSEIPPLGSHGASTLTRTAANGIMAPSSLEGQPSTGGNIRGRLAAWTSPSPSAGPRTPSQTRRPLPPPPPEPAPNGHYPSLRQTAISISNSFSPAAGLAKRAVERMGRAWGGMHSSHHSGYASSTTSTAPSSYLGNDLVRTSSRQSSRSPTPSKGKRRTPNAPSGAWSISSSTTASTSDSDMFVPSGPHLGTRLRASSESGLVFGRPLLFSVQRAGPIVRGPDNPVPDLIGDREELKVFEDRKLPALVVRCAQHLMVWGVQEEGLFRLNGRPAHIAKLRSEFDMGADFELVESTLGDLDPHAVASVFKAFLRELPEPILTKALGPHFEAVILAEQNEVAETEKQHVLSQSEFGIRGPTLPSNPRNGSLPLRKPPSLSTLGLPKLTSMRPASPKLIYALASLIDRLPPENRDLLLTVTELIKATARESKETRMPLSNLLLVFCPSLSMNPPLLRVLCEEQRIWEGAQLPIFDIKRESRYVDISAKPKDEDEHSLPALIMDSTSSQSSLVSDTLTSPDKSLDPQQMMFTHSSESLSKLPGVPFPPNRDDDAPESPVLVDASQIPTSPPRRRPKLEGLIQFPSFGSNPPTPLSTRKSVQSLSLPSLSKAQDSPDSPVSPSGSLRGRKRDKPSLHRLLGKRSSSALTSGAFPVISAPILLPARHENDSPVSVQSYTLPSIESSPLGIANERPSIERPTLTPPRNTTPIADLYLTPAGSQVSLEAVKSVKSVHSMQRTDSSNSNMTFCSLPSTSRLDLLDTGDDEDDWTRSVLLAADFKLDGSR